MTINIRTFKYETLFKVTYEIVQTWTNVTITLQTGVLTNIINTHHIMPFKNNTEVE